MAKDRKYLEGAKHGRSCYNAGCDCEAGRRANSEYLKAYRARKRAEKLAAAGLEVPDEQPADEPTPEPEPEPGEPGPIEAALAADLEGDGDGEPRYLAAVARTVARALDGAARTRRHDLISPLAQRMVDVGTRLFPPAPTAPGDDEDAQRAEILQLINGGGESDEPEEEAAGGA